MNEPASIEAIVLAVINLINLIISSYNARRINTVRTEQKKGATALANGTVHAARRRP